MSFQRKSNQGMVTLHVYDINQGYNTIAHHVGVGTYHTGIEFFGVEYSFGKEGITKSGPKQASMTGSECVYRESIELGQSEWMQSDISSKLIPKLKKLGFLGRNYDTLKKNCNHFSDAMSQILLNKEGKSVIPSWVNRSAGIGSFFSNLVGSSSTTKK